MGRVSLNKTMPWLLIGAWVGLTATAFWWLELRYYRVFSDTPGRYVVLNRSPQLPPRIVQQLRALVPDGGVTLINFRDPGCPCARFTEPHFAEIVAKYSPMGLHVLTVDAAETKTNAALRAAFDDWLEVPSSPAALVVDRDGDVAYFGPYSDGAGCFTGTGTFVERAIDSALAGHDAPRLNLLSTGCYCVWPSAADVKFENLESGPYES